MSQALRISPSGAFDGSSLDPSGPVSVFDFLLPGGSIVDAINDAFADEASTEVYFPPYRYVIDGPIASLLDGKVIRFISGSVLVLVPQAVENDDSDLIGVFSVVGENSRIVGDVVIEILEESDLEWVALDLQGVGTMCTDVLFYIAEDVENCSLVRQSGDTTTLGDLTLTGFGSFSYAIEFKAVDGDRVSGALAGRVLFQMVDDNVTTRNYDALVRYHSTRCHVGGIDTANNGRQLINAVLDVDGTHNSASDVQLRFSSGTLHAVLTRDDAEFFEICGGNIQGNFLANSVGMRLGDGSKTVGVPAVGQVRCFDVHFSNWKKGVRITGSADAVGFFGGAIANNETCMVEVDAERSSGPWPVSGLSFFDVYSEERSFPGAPFLHLVSGSLPGGIVAGGEIGYTGTAVLVEAAMGTNSIDWIGVRLPASAPTDAVTTPNANSTFYFTPGCSLSGSNLVGKGANAAKAMKALDPTLTGLVIGTKGTGTANNRMTQHTRDVYTLNFGDIAAGATQALTFFYPGLGTDADLLVTFGTGFAAKMTAGIQFSYGLSSADHFIVTASNTSVLLVAAVTGNAEITVTTYG